MIQKCLLFYYIIWLVLSFSNCGDHSNLSEIPRIWFISFSKAEILQGDINQDSVWLEIGFEDGDGDLGFGSGSAFRDIYLIDRRTSIIQDAYKLPDLPESSGKSVNGTIKLRVYNTCCLFPLGIPPCSSPVQYPKDSLSYDVFIEDRAGNKSPIIQTPFLYLRCK